MMCQGSHFWSPILGGMQLYVGDMQLYIPLLIFPCFQQRKERKEKLSIELYAVSRWCY